MIEGVGGYLVWLNSGLVVAGVIAIFKWVRQVSFDIHELQQDVEHIQDKLKDNKNRIVRIEEWLYRRGGSGYRLHLEDKDER